MDGYKYPPMALEIFNFFRVLKLSSREVFNFVSINLAGPAIRFMQRRNIID